MKPIGGYFELELRCGNHFHKDAIKLNSARNCFEFILRARKYKKIYIPYYTCDVMLEPLKKCNVDYEFYHVNESLEPVRKYEINKSEAFLYTNYYGLKQNCVERLASIYGSNLIVDNAQAFYAKPIYGIDTFYSARKFFGVADGAYLYSNCKLEEDFERDQSYSRMSHLLKRVDVGAEYGYQDFKTNDADLANNPIRMMSNLTEKILCSIDYELCKKRRMENFHYLAEHLNHDNKILFSLSEDDVPMVYPYYTVDSSLSKQLIDHKTFVARYWPNVIRWCKKNDLEYRLTECLLPLPIDQRYGLEDMNQLYELINTYGER